MNSIVVLLSNSDCLFKKVKTTPLDEEEESKDCSLNDYMEPNEELLEGQISVWLKRTDKTCEQLDDTRNESEKKFKDAEEKTDELRDKRDSDEQAFQEYLANKVQEIKAECMPFVEEHIKTCWLKLRSEILDLVTKIQEF